MPLGSIPSTRRLGIANLSGKNASTFATTVLRLQSNAPIYQQQLVHSQDPSQGPAKAAAEWCGIKDNEYNNVYTIREISAHDTTFSRRNLSNAPGEDFLEHRNNYNNQLYYLGNEPEAGSLLTTGSSCNNDCWNPRDWSIDPNLSGTFPNPNSQFWENRTAGFQGNCYTADDTAFKRIRSDALAYVFLRMKREAESLGRGHSVLPPAAINAPLGSTDPYWQNFYDCVHLNGVTIGISHEDPISPSNLKAIHIHSYSNDPGGFQNTNPADQVAMSATWIRKGADWYKGRYVGADPIPANILVSEMGVNWELLARSEDRVWAGGWPGYRLGLAWWNTYLCWFTRNAASNCNLSGWESGVNTVYGCIHGSHGRPYSTDQPTNITRNQWYFNSDAWDTYVANYMPAKQINGLVRDWVLTPAYEKSFTASNSISWGGEGRTWRRTPFGACYAVWAQVGADPTGQNLNTGWVLSTSQGIAGTASVSLPSGYSTVYFPVIKTMGTFDPYTQINVRWVRNDGAIRDQGVMSLSDFQDSGVFAYNGYNHTAMVYPVVCYASTARTVTVQLMRNRTGVGAWLGRPIILPGACSWFITQ